MISYLIKILILTVFSFIIAYLYYFTNSAHIENFNWYLYYIIIIFIIWSFYKYFQLESNKNQVKISSIKIFLYFLLHLFILCLFFFWINGDPLNSWVQLFIKIIWYLFFPIFIIFISFCFWKKIISYLSEIKSSNFIYNFILSLSVWFFWFVFLLSILWILGFYNLYSVFLILLVFIGISYKEIWSSFKSLFCHKFCFDIKEWFYLKLISWEFLFLVSTLVLCISLISIVRPFPIWWDDLWAYMNFPHLMSEAWIIHLPWMLSWQTFTGVWYMLGSSTQAFFFNVMGGFLSIITLILITSDFLKSNKKTFINIPLLVWTMFIAMPMVVFQQAKDMKLDEGLFFVSICSIYLLFKYFLSQNKEKKNNNIIILIIWILAWFAFTIKFTSLLLISAIIWVIFFVRLWVLWFLWYIAIFLAIFTKADLRSLMNVVVNPLKIPWFETIFAIISWIIWIIFLVFSFIKNKNIIKILLIELIILLLWIIISLSPWIWKNINQVFPKITISWILSWKWEYFNFDKSIILSEKKIKKIENKLKQEKADENIKWTTQNEDFGRYLGYELGINNLIKLPFNLTMQRNQGWEFTDIWFLFLALLPVVFLFLPFRKKYYPFLIVFLLTIELLLFLTNIFTPYLSGFNLPLWYSVILISFLLPTLFLLFTLKDTSRNKLFKFNLVFASFYTFLWTISSFWIVRYWIAMYFSFLLMIAFGAYYLSNYQDNYSNKKIIIKLFWTIVFFSIFLIYCFNSIYPHSFNNLKWAWYKEFKTGQINNINAPYLYHKEYLKILYSLNIADNKKQDFLNKYIDIKIKKVAPKILELNIYDVINILNELKNNKKYPLLLNNSAQKSLQKIYKNISNPENKFKNQSWIYRVWTFLKYYISENNKRLVEDWLLTTFNNYIYDESINKTVSNLKKLWLWYLLIDLNAATIDKDPRHNLTKRYEKLLSIFISNKLELIETDSVCLKIALENFSKSEKTQKDKTTFILEAWVNYESYTSDWKIIYRWQKLNACYNNILKLINEKKINNTNYGYLLNIDNYIKENSKKYKDIKTLWQLFNKQIPAWYKVLFKIK